MDFANQLLADWIYRLDVIVRTILQTLFTIITGDTLRTFVSSTAFMFQALFVAYCILFV